MIPGKPYDPATEASRRPTPEEFEHLRKWVDPEERFVELTELTDITNINWQLQQVNSFFISSVIQRVIAHMSAAYGGGFISLQATADGALLVAPTGSGKEILSAAISFDTAASQLIVAAVAGKKIKVTNLTFIVEGETDLTLLTGSTGLSGTMSFGGTDEPRGMVHSLGDSPLATEIGEGFYILSSEAVQVSGYCTYYLD